MDLLWLPRLDLVCLQKQEQLSGAKRGHPFVVVVVFCFRRFGDDDVLKNRMESGSGCLFCAHIPCFRRTSGTILSSHCDMMSDADASVLLNEMDAIIRREHWIGQSVSYRSNLMSPSHHVTLEVAFP